MKNIPSCPIPILLAFIALAAAIFPACTNETPGEANVLSENSEKLNALSQALVFERLAGTWKSEDGKTYEQWIKKADGTFRSRVYTLIQSDTMVSEEATIYQENGQWVFENTVKGQNDGQSVKFYSTQLTDNSVQFSNPAHDFPTDVNYILQDNNTVRAFIIGPNKKGNKDTIPFNYSRVN